MLAMRFGISNLEPMTLEQFGSVQGVIRERFRQIESLAMEKLRAACVYSYLRDFVD